MIHIHITNLYLPPLHLSRTCTLQSNVLAQYKLLTHPALPSSSNVLLPHHSAESSFLSLSQMPYYNFLTVFLKHRYPFKRAALISTIIKTTSFTTCRRLRIITWDLHRLQRAQNSSNTLKSPKLVKRSRLCFIEDL